MSKGLVVTTTIWRFLACSIVIGWLALNPTVANSESHPKAKADEAAAEDHPAAGHNEHGPKLGTLISIWSVAPFVFLLGCIAVFPLVNPHWWEHNTNKGIIVAALAIPTALYLIWKGEPGIEGLEHALKEYVSFVVLLGALFIISGGVYVRGSLKGTPVLNAAFLGIGASIASLVGTTGASMLLIRPLLRANQHRERVAHIVIFFIFTVSNCGGLLTPLGDPPLFLGFLKGVPFGWTLRLWPQWLVVNGILVATFFIWDSIVFSREYRKTEVTPAEVKAVDVATEPAQIVEVVAEAPQMIEVAAPPEQTLPVAAHESPKPETAIEEPKEPFGIEGAHNFAYLAAIVAIIYGAGQNIGGFGAAGEPWPWGIQETLMALVAGLAFLTTSGKLRKKNRFSFGPIIEVAVLFIGIFCTMIPALAILNVEGKSLGVKEPWQFFWVTGTLSSFLDNAPTYIAFAVTAAGINDIPDQGRFMADLLALGDHSAAIVAAISCGAVFMGANTYIGNGPNFMVKAIAEENNVRMPSFFGYMAYSIGILIPIFLVVTFVFFRP